MISTKLTGKYKSRGANLIIRETVIRVTANSKIVYNINRNQAIYKSDFERASQASKSQLYEFMF